VTKTAVIVFKLTRDQTKFWCRNLRAGARAEAAG